MLATLGCLLCSQFLGKTRAAVKEALSAAGRFQPHIDRAGDRRVAGNHVEQRGRRDFFRGAAHVPAPYVDRSASVELLTRSPNFTQDIPVPEGKTVFPHDASDFELIRQHGHEYLNCTLTYRISHVLRSR
ncbi:hypothetical protein PF002_g21243 [Phytophthora fragariae]|uniref:Uncharacterized protein n=1 Tax=Phytophthora fragariae TaxID=53985 RepID=A0A6A3XJS3_9STRA|nr:hypothetical protein PF002_g21243 [Phytophthora fragariae]